MKLEKALLPMDYEYYVFDLYGTLVDIHTEEKEKELWEKMALFYGYYGAFYEPEEMQEKYDLLVKGKEGALKLTLESDPHYAHEASPEIEITEVFEELFLEKGVQADKSLSIHAGQFFRVLSTEYIRVYPGTKEMLEGLRRENKKILLLSNAQRIFTEYEMRFLGLFPYFDEILISSDHQTKKPDPQFFQLLMQEHGVEPDKTLFIGNDSRCDVGGAKTVGFAAFYVNSNLSPENDSAEEADYIVDSFEKWEWNR